MNALKARYKFFNSRDVVHFYDLPEDKKGILQSQGTNLRSRSDGIEYGNHVPLMDAAKYIKKACDSVLKVSIENRFRKVDISSQYFDDIELFEETSIEEQMVKLIDGMSDHDVNDITEVIHVGGPTSKEFAEAIKG
jgi:hypothetical protein